PISGQTTTIRVSAWLFNPTSQPITFSSANPIRLNIPGGGVVYGGGAHPSQGSVTQQPAVGGTGNLVWNPGTVAANTAGLASATRLDYLVRVTPTSSGQRIPVVASPGSRNGTRAQYVDETGNTTQTRATTLVGPLCEVAVTEGAIVPLA